MRTAVALAVLVALPAVGPWSPTTSSGPCPGFALVAGQGPSCPVPGGWEVLLPGGGSVFTHGPDAAGDFPAQSASAASAPPAPPLCVDPATAYHGRAIYAVAADRVDRYSWMGGAVRDLVLESNGVLRADAWDDFALVADFRFRCSGGEVEIAHAVLPTPAESANFATIVSDLLSLGFSDSRAKYWVWYDGDMGPIWGEATLERDDRLSVDNANNAGPSYGITYNKTWGNGGAPVMLHENAHNLGAVQWSAPHTSGAGHCNDGQDVMCYTDGGPNSTFDPNVCAATHLDCHHDDYFNPRAPNGTYLATHWNLGSALNRFIRIARCAFTSSSQIALGAYEVVDMAAGPTGATILHVVASRNIAIPAPCAGERFTLSGNLPLDDFNICWMQAPSTQLRCDTAPGTDSGTVPAGTSWARVIYRFGAAGTYTLSIG